MPSGGRAERIGGVDQDRSTTFSRRVVDHDRPAVATSLQCFGFNCEPIPHPLHLGERIAHMRVGARCAIFSHSSARMPAFERGEHKSLSFHRMGWKKQGVT